MARGMETEIILQIHNNRKQNFKIISHETSITKFYHTDKSLLASYIEYIQKLTIIMR